MKMSEVEINELNSILIENIKRKNLVLVTVVTKLGADPNFSNGLPLIKSAEVGALEIMKFLINKGADIYNNDNVLFTAVKNNQSQIINFLLSKKLSPEINKKSIDYVIENNKSEILNTFIDHSFFYENVNNKLKCK